jgi:hypothetical protein
MGSKDSPRGLDADVEYDLWLDHQEELADRPPAVWWDDHLADIGTKRAKQAAAALRRITGNGCPPVVVLEALWVVSDYKAHPPSSRHVLLAHAEHIQQLIDAAEKAANDLLFYGAPEKLSRAIRTVCESGPSCVTELRADADKLRRNRDRLLTAAIFALLREVARATGTAQYRDVRILLAAVGVNRSEGALKVLASRAGGGLSPRPAKKPPQPRRPRGRPHNPNAIRNKGPREVAIGTAAELEALEAAVRAPRRGNRRHL